jgi:SAM-dependent methyltransferase
MTSRRCTPRGHGNEWKVWLLVMACLCSLLNGALRAQRPGEDRDFRSARHWNEIYEHRLSSRAYNLEPNAWLQESIRDLPPGRALDIGMGDGRNALFLAERGWNVTGIEISDGGIRKALEKARVQRLRLDARITEVERFNVGSSKWDLILLFYVHPLVRSQAERVMRGLAPGGRVLVEDFSAEGTSDVDLFKINELLSVFGSLSIRYYEDSLARPDWGLSRESTFRRIVRLNAEKR